MSFRANWVAWIQRNSLAGLAVLLCLPTAGLGQTAEEYALKASFMARFTEFVEWPEGAPDDDTFVVSVIGDGPFDGTLEAAFTALEMPGRNVDVRRISFVEEAEGSQILFISRSEVERLEQIVAFTRDKPILTVSDMEDAAPLGVIINFYIEERRVRFEIDPSAIEETGLSLSSLLLSYARIVGPGNQGR